MAVPVAPTDFTVVQEAVGSPQVTAQWSHAAPTTVTYVQLLKRRTGTTTWFVHLIGTAGDFGDPSPYSVVTASLPGYDWKVLAQNADGPSVTNPTATFTGQVEGVWLLPHRAGVLQSSSKVFVQAESTPWNRPQDVAVYEPKGRTAKMVQLGDLYSEEGTVSGSFNLAFTIAAEEWRERFETLLETQKSYTVWLVSPHLMLNNVTVYDASMSPWVAESNNYDVGFAYTQGS
jgi:hypothetical protein